MSSFRKIDNPLPPFDEFLDNYVRAIVEDSDVKPTEPEVDSVFNPSSEAYKKIHSVWEITLKDDIRVNDTYQVAIDWSSHDHDCLSPSDDLNVVHLSIKRLDNDVIVDYRDLMAIKDELVGEEHEALMLFPARSREHDTANQYHLWIPVMKSGEPVLIPFGWDNGRHVYDGSKLGASQRPFKESAE